MSDFSWPLSTHKPFIIFFSLLYSWGREWYRGFDGHLASIQGQNTTIKEKRKDKNQHWPLSFPTRVISAMLCWPWPQQKNASEAQELLAKKTCLWLNQWIAPKLSLLCLCMSCCLSFWSLIILIGLNFFHKDWCCMRDFLYSSRKHWHTIVTNIKGPT